MNTQNYYIAVVEPDNSVIIKQNTKASREILKRIVTKNSKIYRVRGHTVQDAVNILSKHLDKKLIQTVLPRKTKYPDVEQINLGS